jgi:hypothetical protein
MLKFSFREQFFHETLNDLQIMDGGVVPHESNLGFDTSRPTQTAHSTAQMHISDDK